MIFIIYKKSNLKYAFHCMLKADALQCGQRDLSSSNIDLISLLFDISATLLQISTFLGALKGNQAGRYLHRHIYDMNKKTEDLQNIAIGLLPDCADAEKTIAKLENE